MNLTLAELLELLKTEPTVKLRDYSDQEIEQFLADDVMDEKTAEIARKFTERMELLDTQRVQEQSQ